MKNKSILIITTFFAPETHAAVFRAHKLVKYLKREGWNPIVLTVDTNYLYNEDLKLLEELNDVPVFRARYVEPTLRGLKMWLTGNDSTYKTLKKKGGIYNNKVTNITAHTKESLQSKIYTYILDHWANSPDRYWTWERNATKMAKQLIEKYNIGVVYTTCLPFTTNKIGINLKKSTNIRWVADFRDPITYAKRMYSDIDSIFLKQKEIQDLTFKYADKVSVLSSAYELIFHDQYEGLYSDKIVFIPTGLDDDYLPIDVIESDYDDYMIFTGEYLKEYEDHFLKIYKKAILDLPDFKVMKVKVIGNIQINKYVLLPLLLKHGLVDKFEFIDHLPQQQLYNYIIKAKYALLFSGKNTLWWTNFAKLVDYIALKKTVIALVPDISEAKSELIKAGLGFFISEDEISVDRLRNLFLRREDFHSQMNEDYCNRYLATSQTNAFITIFNSLQ